MKSIYSSCVAHDLLFKCILISLTPFLIAFTGTNYMTFAFYIQVLLNWSSFLIAEVKFSSSSLLSFQRLYDFLLHVSAACRSSSFLWSILYAFIFMPVFLYFCLLPIHIVFTARELWGWHVQPFYFGTDTSTLTLPIWSRGEYFACPSFITAFVRHHLTLTQSTQTGLIFNLAGSAYWSLTQDYYIVVTNGGSECVCFLPTLFPPNQAAVVASTRDNIFQITFL